MIAHSVALRASQTAAEIGDELGLATHEFEGIHEVQVGDLENRNDDEAIERVQDHLPALARGRSRRADARRRDRLARCWTGIVPVLTQLRMRYLDDDAFHGDIVVVSHGAAIRLASAVLAGVDGSFALDHHLGNTESVVLAPITDGRWSCVQWGAVMPPFYPEPTSTPSRTRCSQPTRWADAEPTASQRAADRIAVDAESVHHFGCLAVGLGAFGAIRRVVDDGAMAVLQTRPRQSRHSAAHGPVSARTDAKSPKSAACRVSLRLLAR